MKYIPERLHYFLLRFSWYRRRTTVLPISDFTNEALKALEQSLALAVKVNKTRSKGFKEAASGGSPLPKSIRIYGDPPQTE